MNRKAIATLILAGLVIVGTSGASGGCGSGGDGGTSAPAVGAGGEQSAPSEEHSSSAEETADEPSEPPKAGQDPCNAHLSPITVGHKVAATLTVGPCAEEPEQYDGTLELQFGTGDLPHVNWDRATVIPIYSTDATQTISAPCQDTYWVVVYDTSGRDHNGHGFSQSYSRFYDDVPRKADCP
jgi:hypothetical protein